MPVRLVSSWEAMSVALYRMVLPSSVSIFTNGGRLLDDVALDGLAGLELDDVELGLGGAGCEERGEDDERGGDGSS